ncbi:hypothetical protein T08_3556 [Trichinella sp. T8]|nr:hypothetical protein T08_3556 [Trichinella sp. T8]
MGQYRLTIGNKGRRRYKHEHTPGNLQPPCQTTTTVLLLRSSCIILHTVASVSSSSFSAGKISLARSVSAALVIPKFMMIRLRGPKCYSEITNSALELSGLYNWFSQRRKVSTFDNPITTVSH